MFQYWEVTTGIFIIMKGILSVWKDAVAPPLWHTAKAAAGLPITAAPLEKALHKGQDGSVRLAVIHGRANYQSI